VYAPAFGLSGFARTFAAQKHRIRANVIGNHLGTVLELTNDNINLIKGIKS